MSVCGEGPVLPVLAAGVCAAGTCLSNSDASPCPDGTDCRLRTEWVQALGLPTAAGHCPFIERSGV